MSNTPLIYQIFDAKKAKLLEDLYRSESQDGRKAIQEVIAEQLGRSDSIVLGQELNQLCLLMMEAKFIESEEEPIQVAAMTFFCLRKIDVLPKITEDSGKNLASKCLISISLFEPALKRLQDYHGAPSPNFYRDIGKGVLKTESMPEVSKNFDNWVNFLNQKLI